jgi:hypothetical protein
MGRFTIGPSYFDSLNAWPKGTRLSYGFNLKNSSAGAQQNMVDTVKAACKAIDQPNLSYWEMGNEPDVYPGKFHKDPKQYVDAWQAAVKAVQDAIAQACPSFSSVGFLGPSFSGPVNQFNETGAFQAGLNSGKNIQMFSSHK